MLGYKGFNKDLTCRDFHYKIGEVYKTEEHIEPCRSGFHFCKNLTDCFDYYDKNESRFCLVEAQGEILQSQNKFVTDKLKIIRELNPIEINRIKYGDGDGNGYGYGDGDGDGYGDGYGYGYGDGDGYGYGDGYGDGDVYGYGNGDGNGYGDGINIQKILSYKEIA